MDNIEFKDNSKAVIQAVDEAIIRALEICGGMAESYAMENIKAQGAVDSTALISNIKHTVDTENQIAYIGTNTKSEDGAPYPIYVEYGTGIHYEGGRRTSWTYQDSKGNWHKTNGMKPRPFLKPALEKHQKEYQEVIETEIADALKGNN